MNITHIYWDVGDWHIITEQGDHYITYDMEVVSADEYEEADFEHADITVRFNDCLKLKPRETDERRDEEKNP